MPILPDVTEPSATRLGRAHLPRQGRWDSYRDCLRWEFGFTCAFCLVHEADLVEHGAAGTGLTSIEHKEPRSLRPDLADEYANCFHACRFCNGARGKRPVTHSDGRRLLDPCSTPWGVRFRAEDGRMIPAAGDADAEYTHRTYRLDDERRVEMRRHRGRQLGGALRTLREAPGRIERLLRIAAKAPPEVRREIEDEVRDLSFRRGSAEEALLRYHAIPVDAPRACLCGVTVERRLQIGRASCRERV